MNQENVLAICKRSILKKIEYDESISNRKKEMYFAYFGETFKVKNFFNYRYSHHFCNIPIIFIDKFNVFGHINRAQLIERLVSQFRIGIYGDKLEIYIEDLDKFIVFFRKITNNSIKYNNLDGYLESYDKELSDEFVLKYSDILNFRSAQRKNQVHWNFELIDKLKDKLIWSYLASYDYLDWTHIQLHRYKGYISKEKKAFSSSSSIKWSEEILDSIIDIWDWTELSSNENVCWTEIMIDKYCKYLNFNKLSINTKLEWNEELINKYYLKWDWSKLSANIGINWTKSMIDRFSSHIDFLKISSNNSVNWNIELISKYRDNFCWKSLSNNKGLPWSFELLEMFSEYWIWQPISCDYTLYDKYYNRGFYNKTVNLHHASLSTNEGISWTIEMVDKWHNKLDFWLLARFGKLTLSVLQDYCAEFDREEFVYYTGGRNFDNWVYENGWQCLCYNKNFKINSKMVLYLHDKIIELTCHPTDKISDKGEIVYENKMDEILKIKLSLLELFQDNDVVNIALTDIICSYNSWGKTLLNEKFINNQVYRNEIIPLLEKMINQDS